MHLRMGGEKVDNVGGAAQLSKRKSLFVEQNTILKKRGDEFGESGGRLRHRSDRNHKYQGKKWKNGDEGYDTNNGKRLGC